MLHRTAYLAKRPNRRLFETNYWGVVNGSLAALPGIDWLCVSPKAGAPWVQRQGDELKVVWPQEGLDLAALEAASFSHRYLQPMDGPAREENTATCIAQCLSRPAWKLSLQTHKITGIR